MKRHGGSVWAVIGGSLAGVFVACGGDVLNDVGDLPGGAGGRGGTAGAAGSSSPGGTDNLGGSSSGSGSTLQAGAAGAIGAGGSSGCDCAGLAVSWQSVDHYGEFEGDSSHVSCSAYRRERRVWQMGAYEQVALCDGSLSCDADAEAVDVGELASALQHADVLAAQAEAPTFYGSDPRPSGGAVLQITLGDALIEVGGDCAEHPSCTPVPEGVAALVTTLQQLEEQELAEGECVSRCPDSPLTAHLGEACTRYGLECPQDDAGCSITCVNGSWMPTSAYDPDCEVGGGGGFGGFGGGGEPAGGGGGG